MKYLETKINSIEEAISKTISKKETELDEAKFQVNYSKGGKLFSKTINAKDEDDAEEKAIKQFKIDDDDIRSVVKESLDEGYEANVMKILKRKGLEGAAYFKNNNLMVSKRDFDAVKKALRFDKIPMTPPKIVVEDSKMMKLTKRQRQALSSPAAKGKGKGGITLPGAEFLSKKKQPMKVGRQSQVVKYEENEMNIVDTVKGIVEKKLDPVNKDAVKKKFDDRKDKDIDNDGDVDSTDKYLHKRRKAISKAVKNEVYDIGKDYAEHTLEVTPGQDKKDVDKMLNISYTKNQGMREALAKVWGLGEGKSPFQKEEEKPLTKTMTGQKPTTVKVNPKIEEK